MTNFTLCLNYIKIVTKIQDRLFNLSDIMYNLWLTIDVLSYYLYRVKPYETYQRLITQNHRELPKKN